MEQDNHIEFDAKVALELGFDAETAAQFGISLDGVETNTDKTKESEVKSESNTETFDNNTTEETSDMDNMSSQDSNLDDDNNQSVKLIKVCESEGIMSRIREYISNDSCNVVFAVTEKFMASAKEDEEIARLLQGADMLMASSDLKSEEAYVQNNEEGLDVHIITQIADDENIDNISIMLMTQEQELADKFENTVNDMFEEHAYLDFTGSYVLEEGTDDDSILNEINANLPDVLICACKTPYQEEWLLENRSKMSVKLCIALSGEKEEFLQKKYSAMGFFAKLFGRK